jgi:7-cyano-7-deazaguanine synthase
MVLLSGGMDSTVLASKLRKEGDEVYGLTVHYGQRHAREIDAAMAVAQSLNIKHQTIWVPKGILENPESSQSGGTAVPEGSYDEAVMRTTVVPNRNMFLLSIATARAIANKCDRVAYAAHSGDHAVYPDCRGDFVISMAEAIHLCDWNPPRLIAPFLESTKAHIVRVGLEVGAPFQLTWTCYKGETHHCGRCGTCVERLEAFHMNGCEDFVTYEDTEFWKTAVAK